MMEDLGLNPDDDQENYNTPVGIGNLCGNNVVRDRLDDGVNQVKSKFYKKRGATFFYDVTRKLGPLDFTQYRSKSSSF